VEIPDVTLEDLEVNLQGPEQAQFLQFIRKMVQWEPEKRLSAKQLLEDPWLKGPWRRESCESASS
jgi:serine/threonine protein kinase